MKVFISYSHQDGGFVWHSLVPVLKAGGADVLIDKDRFKAGLGVIGQMDAMQDQAERHVLCLSAAHYGSDPCRHELERALATDPSFSSGRVLPLRLDSAPLPAGITLPNPLWIDLRDATKAAQWKLLLDGCDADLGVLAPTWLGVRAELRVALDRYQSTNLLVTSSGAAWYEMILGLRADAVTDLAFVDLQKPHTIERRGLCQEILSELGIRGATLPKHPHDLAAFTDQLSGLGRTPRVALVNFDLAASRKSYDANFYAALRWMIDDRFLVGIIQTHRPLAAMLPKDNPVSALSLPLIELK